MDAYTCVCLWCAYVDYARSMIFDLMCWWPPCAFACAVCVIICLCVCFFLVLCLCLDRDYVRLCVRLWQCLFGKQWVSKRQTDRQTDSQSVRQSKSKGVFLACVCVCFWACVCIRMCWYFRVFVCLCLHLSYACTRRTCSNETKQTTARSHVFAVCVTLETLKHMHALTLLPALLTLTTVRMYIS
jgi:hypothetical protein